MQSKRQEDMQKGRVEDAIRRHKQVQQIVPSICYCVTFFWCGILHFTILLSVLFLWISQAHMFSFSYIEFIYFCFF